jgi:threonine synthase
MPTYTSTRDASVAISASQAIINGISPDGGLYVPTAFPTVALDWEVLKNASYQDIAKLVFGAFLDDFTADEIADVVEKSYDEKFLADEIVPIKQVGDARYLELFHGPTLAFKDIALSALPRLLTTAARKHDLKAKLLILAATSGDTGTAAMAGFGNVPNTEIVVFYPEVGVSEIQRQQMVTEDADNAHVIAIEGNFDDAQTAVKQLFADNQLQADLASAHYQFSSANSINIGRLVPQIAYYVWAYAQLVAELGDAAPADFEVVVPTGNFGNVLAGYYAQQIGVPIKRFVVASNENNVLSDFFATGTYDINREFLVSTSPAMDILISSNLERLLYFASGRNVATVVGYMNDLREKKAYTINDQTKAGLTDFVAGFASNEEVNATIARTYQEEGYLLDPHTAVGATVAARLKTDRIQIIAATASPYKFPQTVLAALGATPAHGIDGLVQLAGLTKINIPAQIQTLFDKPIKHTTVIAPTDIQTTLRAELLP